MSLDGKRLLLLILVVGLFAAAFTSYLFFKPQRPFETKADDILSMLTSADGQQQYKGISLSRYVKHTDPELTPILNTLADIALTSERSEPGHDSERRQAALRLADILWSIVMNNSGLPSWQEIPRDEDISKSDFPPLDPDKLKQLLSLFMAEDAPDEMIEPLARISASTYRWQTEPKNKTAHLIKLLEVANKYETTFLLKALEGYTRLHDLPENGMNILQEILRETFNGTRKYTNSSEWSDSLIVAQIFKSITVRRALPPLVRQTVVKFFTSHIVPKVRSGFAGVLQAEAKRTGKIPEELYAAEKVEKDPQVKIAITNAIREFRVGTQPTFEDWLALSHDKTVPGDVRKSAIEIVTGKPKLSPILSRNLELWLADEDAIVRGQAFMALATVVPTLFKDHDKLLPYLNSGINDPNANVRAASLHAVFRAPLPVEQKLRFAELALQDKDPRVRVMLAGVLTSKDIPRDKSIPILLQLLKDDNADVSIKTMRSVSAAGINTSSILLQIERLTASEDPNQKTNANRTLNNMKRDSRSSLEKLTDYIPYLKSSFWHFVFWLLAGVGMVISAVFGLYYFAAIFSNISEGSSRSLVATIALLVWIGLSLAMGYAFFFGAFGFSETPVNLALALTLGLALYGGLGFLMKRLVRPRKWT